MARERGRSARASGYAPAVGEKSRADEGTEPRAAGGRSRPPSRSGTRSRPEGRSARASADPGLTDPGSSFVGRERELASIHARFAAGARLVTLVGPPGTGKTRLALRVLGDRPRAGHEERVLAVDLAPARTEDDLVAAVARALGASLAGVRSGEAAHARVTHALDRRRTFLLLDNFEQIADHAPVVARWLARTRGLSVLATSRERLRVASEEPLEIPPLGLPDAEGDPMTSESIRLLLARAPGFSPSPTDAAPLTEIARSLEGLPLALELAASRLPLLGADALATMLRNERGTLDALGPAPREVTPRQATLRGAIAWSWSILEEPERRALAFVSMFRGSFALELALAVIGGSEADALAVVQSLRDKSLLAPAEGATRARTLTAVRAFAAEKLAERADAEQARARLVRAFASRAARERRARTGRHARAAQAWLALEADGLEVARELAETLPLDPETAAREAELVLALHDVARRIGPAGRDAPALANVERLLPSLRTDLRTELVVARANALRDRGETLDAARSLEAEAAEGASSYVLSALGQALLACGRFDAAESALERALASAAGDRRLALAAHGGLGLVAHGRGVLERAEAHYARALDLAISLGEPAAEAAARRDLGNLSLQRGELDRARAHYEEALAKRPGDDLRLEGVVRGNLGIVHQELGELDLALAELRRARDCLRQVGDRPFEAHLSGYLGAVLHERGQLDAARDAYGEAIEILREVHDVRLEGIFLAARAVLLAERGQSGHAENDLVLAARRIEEVGDPALTVLLALHRATVALTSAARGRGDVAGASATARALIERVLPEVDRSDDARFALRMLRRALPADALEVGEGAAWFRVPGREAVSLASRPTLARVLDALVLARLARPGAALAWDELLAAGWPDEKVMPAAAQNRVRVALSTLRTLGLRSVLVTENGGHRLDEHVSTQRG